MRSALVSSQREPPLALFVSFAGSQSFGLTPSSWTSGAGSCLVRSDSERIVALAPTPLLRNTTRRARLFIFQHQDPICSLTALLQVSIFAEPCGIFVSREAFSLCLVAARLGMREAFPRVIVLECHCTILHIIAFGRLTAMRLAIEPRASCA